MRMIGGKETKESNEVAGNDIEEPVDSRSVASDENETGDGGGGGEGEATIVAVDSQNTETSMECQNQTVLSNGECSLGVEGSDDATSSSVAEQPPQSVSSSNPDASAEIKERDDKITDESASGQIDFSKEELNEVSEKWI